MHNFQEKLQFSQDHKHEPFWQAIYEKAFPDMQFAEPVTKKVQGQYLGIDRVIYLSSGKTIYVDEKLRDSEYRDIFLETVSNDRTGAVGWMEKDLLIDYLAYAFLHSKRCYLFNWLMLRRAWIHHKDKWQKQYPQKAVPNKEYNTLGIVVPIPLILKTVKNASIISL